METQVKKNKIFPTGTLETAPSLGEFMLIEGYDKAVVTTELSSDLQTPVSAFVKLRATNEESCFLLESAEKGRVWGRYSILGFDPSATVCLVEGGLEVRNDDGVEFIACPNPVKALFETIESARVLVPDSVHGRDTAMPFEGGAVGYFGYRTLARIEKVSLEKQDGVGGVPETQFMFPRRLVVFDHLRSRMRLCVLADVPEAGSPLERERAYAHAVETLEEMAAKASESLPPGCAIPVTGSETTSSEDFAGVASNVTRGEFELMVDRAKEHIFDGDAFQVVVSQRLSVPFDGDPLSVYRYLRAENPSPYMFYFQSPDVTLAGSSPEPMVTNRGGRAVIRPIAGTRPRGADSGEDARLAVELASDPKEKAEHIMLVDLARNDLGRVSKPGKVRVKRLMEVERYSHVMHMVSEVEGELSEEAGNYDLLRASFPAGTVVGAPKVRAGEIVEDLEPEGRGPYAGAVGYVSYSGEMDTCIAIRTVVIRGGVAHVQAGAGVVVDSEAPLEYEETLNKARASIRAVRAAGKAR